MKHDIIPTALIDVSADYKRVPDDAARAIADSIRQIGQRQPIEVIATKTDRFQLVFGAKRLAACKLLARDVMVIIREPDEFKDEAETRLVGIAENFYRHSLTALERSVDVADWCTIWRTAHPVKRGRKAKAELSDNLSANSIDDEIIDASNEFALSFSEAAQRFLNINSREVFRATKIASISADLRERITLHQFLANNQQALLAIAAEPYERASKIVEIILDGKAQTVSDAVAILDGIPPVNEPARWEKISDSFARLKPAEQDAFFKLNEAAILRWFAERKAAN
ncbi:ParB N-terminal domain-containing protein [Ochrobactrum intermedium]|uniref:ParB/RepB/Spo0J family partition protein n=1 Tax=Brucella intermedia TaxID=94625 RepID=UPI00159CBC69|nr:ParB N-terminal domain-containing protein [Brucella intermedia]NVM42700.1 ParB N-terminal domain-containing protein [Brucella intermedia]